MPWVKMDDRFWSHPKVTRAGNESAGIFARCLSYCGSHLTDGRVPMDVALFIAGSREKVEAVVDADLLEQLPSGDLYVRDYADYNPLREQVEAERESRRQRGMKGAAARYSHSNGHRNSDG